MPHITSTVKQIQTRIQLTVGVSNQAGKAASHLDLGLVLAAAQQEWVYLKNADCVTEAELFQLSCTYELSHHQSLSRIHEKKSDKLDKVNSGVNYIVLWHNIT